MNDAGCKYCMQDADYGVQWGPQAPRSGQRAYACGGHIRKLLASIPHPRYICAKDNDNKKLLLENWQRELNEDWRNMTWNSPNGENITVGQVADYLGDNDTIDINVSELMRAREPKEHQQEKERVEAASLEFPIIVVKSGDKYRYILDGNHRLQKAINMGIGTIETKILDLDDTETPEMFVRVFGGAQ